MDLTTKTRGTGSVTIVDVHGRIVLGEESAALRGLIVDLLNRGHNSWALSQAYASKEEN